MRTLAIHVVKATRGLIAHLYTGHFVVLSLLGLFASSVAFAQMITPTIDAGNQPFSYFSQPTDEIGMMNSLSGTEITPEGYLYTGFGELMFFVGPEQIPVTQRIRTLEDGYLPILSYRETHHGIEYRFTMFSASLGQQAGEGTPVVNFVRVSITNTTHSRKMAFFTSAIRYQAKATTASGTGDNRFRRPVFAKQLGDYQQPGEHFNPNWSYGFCGNAFVRDHHVIYLFPDEQSHRLSLTLRGYYNRVSPMFAKKLDVSPLTPTGVVKYGILLSPGGETHLDFLMPVIPISPADVNFPKMQNARFDTYHRTIELFWNHILSRGVNILTSEDKVNDTFRASLIFDLLAITKLRSQYIQTVNLLQYHAFYLRDATDIVRMYDVSGYTKIADRVLGFFATKQQPNGNFLSQPGQYDGWGEAMWIYGEHYRITHDRLFAEAVYPSMVRAVGWLEKARADDPLHLMPATDIRDNEYVSGHLTGYNFLALDGLQAAILIAHDLGHVDDEKRFQQDYDSYHATFLAVLARITANTGGYIPPDLDENLNGTDWGNLLSLTPEQQLNPEDPRVTATLKKTQEKYQEGIMTYVQPRQGIFLHDYLTIKNTLTELIRGEQEQAVTEMYAELLHTSSTQAGFEYAIRPWGNRDFEGNLSPHGWFAADYRNLLRNMMVREEGNRLHLLSAVSPEWIGKGKTIQIDNAPTYFGILSVDVTMPSKSRAFVRIHSEFVNRPSAIVLHLPWFMEVSEVTVHNKRVRISNNCVVLPPDSTEVSITWKRRVNAVSLSYRSVVERYKKEYRRRYNNMILGGASSTMEQKMSRGRLPVRG